MVMEIAEMSKDEPNKNPYSTLMVSPNTQCINCGVKGHIFKECTEPTTSFGIIAYRYGKRGSYIGPVVKRDMKQCHLHQGEADQTVRLMRDEPIYLKVQRKDTFGYIEFVRGRYTEATDPDAMIRIYFSEMTCDERHRLMNWTFDQIWRLLWVNHSSRCFHSEYKLAKQKFNLVDIPKIIQEVECHYAFPEYGFPKGRRILNETDMSCALREFCEETGYKSYQVELIPNQEPICELFTGTNNKKYKNVFYLAYIKDVHGAPKLNPHSYHQSGEISNIAWLTLEHAKKKMRIYDPTKLDVLDEADVRVRHLLRFLPTRCKQYAPFAQF
jgi:ADP-ribose pyrophosphatase YjhB (NUDIX family)